MHPEDRDIAREAGITELEVNILRENKRMLGLARHLGYLVEAGHSPGTSVVLGKGVAPGSAARGPGDETHQG